MDLDSIFHHLVSLKARIEDDLESERNGVPSGYKVVSLRDELVKVDRDISEVQKCLEK